MKKIICTIIGLFCFLSIQASIAMSELYFVDVKGENYISQNNVKAIVQDSYGFMWFGTRNGLNRYDGLSFREFAVDDYEKNCGNHNISAIYEDSQRHLWVGTDKGVYRFNPVTEKFSYMSQPAQDGTVMNNWVSVIEGDHDGNIWIIIPNQGVFKYHEATCAMKRYYFTDNLLGSSDLPQSLCVRRNGEVWMGSNERGLFLYNKEQDCFEQLITDGYGNTSD